MNHTGFSWTGKPDCCVSCVNQSVLTVSFKTGFSSLFVFLKAQLQRGNLLLKQGRLDEAESDYKKVVSKLWSLT